MRSILIIKEFILSMIVAIMLPIFLVVATIIIISLMYITLLDELYKDFKFKTRKKVNDEH
jgi:hypothetical protein